MDRARDFNCLQSTSTTLLTLKNLRAQPGLPSFPILLGSEEVAGIYNILYRYLFDRHRDLRFPNFIPD